MYEPVAIQDILVAVIAGALVVLFGALYAFTFALAKLNKKRWLTWMAGISFAGLGASVLVLAQALNMNGHWQIVTATMLIGYLLAPQAIWMLSVGTHQASDS